ncbi:MAG: hypothetical protein ACR2QE_11145 [Acidimicrobiales bacterium]
MTNTHTRDFTIVLVSPVGPDDADIESHLTDDDTQVIRKHSVDGIVDLVAEHHPQLVLLDTDALPRGAQDSLALVETLTSSSAVVVMGSDDDEQLRLQLITVGAQDYVTRDVLFTDHVLWTVLGSYGRWLFERSLQVAHEERTALEQRLALARDLHDETIQRLFVCRLQLDPSSPGAIGVERELAEIIAHLRGTIRHLSGTGATLLDDVTQVCEHHRGSGQRVSLETIGDLADVADHVRLHLLDAVVTLLTLCASSNTDISLKLEANDHRVELQVRLYTDWPNVSVNAGLDLGRLSHAATRLGGLMGWTWNQGLIRVRWTVPTGGRVGHLV